MQGGLESIQARLQHQHQHQHQHQRLQHFRSPCGSRLPDPVRSIKTAYRDCWSDRVAQLYGGRYAGLRSTTSLLQSWESHYAGAQRVHYAYGCRTPPVCKVRRPANCNLSRTLLCSAVPISCHADGPRESSDGAPADRKGGKVYSVSSSAVSMLPGREARCHGVTVSRCHGAQRDDHDKL